MDCWRSIIVCNRIFSAVEVWRAKLRSGWKSLERRISRSGSRRRNNALRISPVVTSSASSEKGEGGSEIPACFNKTAISNSVEVLRISLKSPGIRMLNAASRSAFFGINLELSRGGLSEIKTRNFCVAGSFW